MLSHVTLDVLQGHAVLQVLAAAWPRAVPRDDAGEVDDELFPHRRRGNRVDELSARSHGPQSGGSGGFSGGEESGIYRERIPYLTLP